MSKLLSQYLESVRMAGFRPPFNLSVAYLKRLGAVVKDTKTTLSVWDSSKESLLFPVLHYGSGFKFLDYTECGSYIWNSLHGWSSPTGIPYFNDFEHVYNPAQMPEAGLDLPVRIEYSQLDGSTKERYEKLAPVLKKWSSGIRKHGDLQDTAPLMQYVTDICENTNIDFGFAVALLEERVVGLAIWDTSFQWLNFRYLLCYRVPGLADWLFTQVCKQNWVLRRGIYVNAGGTFGREGLGLWKSKFAPVEVLQRYSVGAPE